MGYIRYKKLQNQIVKRSIRSVEFKSKIGTKTLWRGKKEWKRRKKRRVWDGKLHKESLDSYLYEKLRNLRSEEVRREDLRIEKESETQGIDWSRIILIE